MKAATYQDGERVEVGDIVSYVNDHLALLDDEPDPLSEDGEIVQIMPRLGAVKVRCEDHHNAYRTTGKPRIKTEVICPSQLNLVRRTL